MLHGTIHQIWDHNRIKLDKKLIGAVIFTGGFSDVGLFLILTNINIIASTLINLAYLTIVMFASYQDKNQW